MIGNKIQVIARGDGQIYYVANSWRRFAPAGKSFVLRLDLREGFDIGRHFGDGLTFEIVACADFDFGLSVEDVEFRDDERIDSVDHFCIAQDGQIEPAAAARTAGD